jgi:hypothetical protein
VVPSARFQYRWKVDRPSRSAAAALGLGGFPHFAAHPFIWFQALGFRMEQVPSSKLMGLPTTGNLPVPVAIGLEREGDVLLKPFCPPYYKEWRRRCWPSWRTSAPGTGTFRDGGVATGWKDAATVQAGIPNYPDREISATIADCDYVHRCYGRFPGSTGSFCTVLAYKAHHVDTDFYDRFYRPEALTQAHRQHPDH